MSSLVLLANQLYELIENLSSAKTVDERLLNRAASLVLDLEQQVRRISDAKDKERWQVRLEEYKRHLQDLGSEVPSTAPTLIVPTTEEGVGDIDDMFQGMNLSDASLNTENNPESGVSLIPQPGRRFIRVVRPNIVAAERPLVTIRSGLPLDGHDVAGQNEETPAVEKSDEEGERYKPHKPARPSSPLRVLLPDLPQPTFEADDRRKGGRPAEPAASQSSNDSTIARRAGENSRGSDSDDSITSPDVVEDVRPL